MQNLTTQEGAIKEIDGQERRLTNGYWIKRYPPHKKDDLHAAIRLVGNFEWRFLKAVEVGMETSTDEISILQRRKLLEAAVKHVESITDRRSLEYKRAEAEEKAYGGMLAVSLFRKMINDISEHISFRIGKDALSDGDKRNLNELRKIIDEDAKEINTLFKYVRRSGGEEDKDQVLEEMRGEPMKLLAATLPEATNNSIVMFYENRYRKIAACWKCIDKTTAAIKDLVVSSKTFDNSGLAEIIDDFSAAAKSRCELSRHDSDFDIAASRLRANRNLIKNIERQGISPRGGHESKITDGKDVAILSLVKTYRELVYDIAHIRTPRDVSTQNLLKNIETLLNPGMMRG